MLLDARSLPNSTTLDADICIVGAGPAGITLAKRFLGQAYRVVLLESGGFESDPSVQSLNASCGDTLGDSDYPRADNMRQRQYGGTANRWQILLEGEPIGIRYVPLEAIDFEKRDWVPYSGWPITKADVDPYYEKAQKLCQIGKYSYAVEDWQTEIESPLNFPSGRIVTRIFQVGSRDVFLKDYREEIEKSENVQLLVYGTAIELETNEAVQTINRVKVACLNNIHFWVAAKIFILAQGGVENARLLLLSDQQASNGLGNQYDQVGRFLMDHPIVRSGSLKVNSRQAFSQMALYDVRRRGPKLGVVGQWSLSEDTIRRERLLHLSTSPFPVAGLYWYNPRRYLFPQGKHYKSAAVDAGIALKRMLRQKHFSLEMLQHLGTMMMGIDDIVYFLGRKKGKRGRSGEMLGTTFSLLPPREYGLDTGGWSYLDAATQAKKYGLFDIIHLTEQAPDPDNRVMIGASRDRLGCRQVQLRWCWNDIDRHSIRRTQDILVEEFAKIGLGKLRLELDRGEPQFIRLSAHHTTGTTRMHHNPREGVVDANCQVHGISNLFIAGSSVFPTGGYANPTLTIIALAIRLADHIGNILR